MNDLSAEQLRFRRAMIASGHRRWQVQQAQTVALLHRAASAMHYDPVDELPDDLERAE